LFTTPPLRTTNMDWLFHINVVCYVDVTLFIYFIVEAHISTLAGQIFVILVSFDRFPV